MIYKDVVNVAAVNFRPFWGKPERNLPRIAQYAEKAAQRGADIVVFPELALTGYDNEKEIKREEKMQVKLAQTAPGDATDVISKVSKEFGIYVVFGMPERDSKDTSKIYNSAVVCGPDGYIGCYRKIHPANDENTWCEKGDEPLVLDTEWGPVGLGICYDSYSFPELMRYYAAKGARLYLNPTAMISDSIKTFVFDWKTCYFDSLRYGVIANDIFIVSSNCVGHSVINEYFSNEVGNDTVKSPAFFAGASVIMGPGFNEKVHIYAGGIDSNESEMIMSTLDLSTASRMIFNENPDSGSPDYRPDIYKKLNEDLLKDPYWKNR